MRDETYGMSIVGLAAGLYGIVVLMGIAHATDPAPVAAFAPPAAEVRAEEVALVAAR